MKNGPYELVIAPPNFPGKKYRGRYAYEHTVVFWKVQITKFHSNIPDAPDQLGESTFS